MRLDKYRTIELIQKRITSIEGELEGRKPWSGLIKKAFIKLANEIDPKLKVATAGAEAEVLGADTPDWGEWLYDLVWYTSEEEASGFERTISVPLVMECEWDASLPSIALDFDKLLVANADLRVMVCGGYKNFDAEPIFEQCNRAVQTYEQGHIGDTFLVCIVPEVGKPQFQGDRAVLT